jgi:dTDP-4-dehydrorhamnose reductase
MTPISRLIGRSKTPFSLHATKSALFLGRQTLLWITGAKGLLGSALCNRCKAALHIGTGHEVDISNRETLRAFVEKNRGITKIINCAAYSLVDAAETNREEAYRANAIGPENLALIAQEIGAQFIHISTDYVFPGDIMRPLNETDRVNPCNYYGKTKLEGEQRALSLSASVIRISGLFGEGGKNFVSQLLQMLMNKKEIRLTDDQWGRFTYAPDLTEALLHMFNRPGLYQYANSGIETKYTFGLAMAEEAVKLGFPVVTESILPVPGSSFPSPCIRPAYSAFDTTKIESIVTIRPWREALRDFLCARLPAFS